MRRSYRKADRGATIIEFALVFPVFIVLVFGIFQFGLGYSAQVTVTRAAREGVRELAIHNDEQLATDAVLSATPTLDPERVTVTAVRTCPIHPDLLDEAVLEVSYPVEVVIPLWGASSHTVTGRSVMRCGG